MPSDKNRIYLLALAALVAAAALYMNANKGADYPVPSTSNQEGIVTKTASADTISTASGLQYRIITEGSGTENPSPSSIVTVHYSGKLTDGTEFDSSYKRNQPASFPVNGVIRGWTEALQLMHVGDKWELTIPSDLAYGRQGAGIAIPPDAILIFEVELLEIK
jgi:FKBP-type peptidyl-prolyl cis-trans isomerase|tara:strand:+ start:109 stop:597 length:489 start_codon:yes stop_codon:yes gene_type:complete